MQDPTPENWRPVPDYEDYYEVSDLGRVKSLRRGRMMSLRHHPGGYRFVSLYLNGAIQQVLIHRLVLIAFAGEPPTSAHEGAHWNGDKTDNRLCNLRWATHDENMSDTIRHGRTNLGRTWRKPTMTASRVLGIRARLAEGVTAIQVARDEGLNVKSVYNISQRRTWAHI